MATKKTTKKAAKKVRAPGARGSKRLKPAAKKQERKTFSITVQATMLMRAELEIDADSYDEAVEMAQEVCDDGGIGYSEFEFIEVVDGPDVRG